MDWRAQYYISATLTAITEVAGLVRAGTPWGGRVPFRPRCNNLQSSARLLSGFSLPRADFNLRIRSTRPTGVWPTYGAFIALRGPEKRITGLIQLVRDLVSRIIMSMETSQEGLWESERRRGILGIYGEFGTTCLLVSASVFRYLATMPCHLRSDFFSMRVPLVRVLVFAS